MITIQIETTNDAFVQNEDAEVIQCLDFLVQLIQELGAKRACTDRKIRDSNGNTVCRVQYEDAPIDDDADGGEYQREGDEE